MSYEEVASQFVTFYYQAFDADRSQLMGLYGPDSMMTFEGAPVQGPENITAKFVGLTFQAVQHVVTTIDCQPSEAGMIVVFVVGQLKTDDDPPHGFSQTFVLKPAGGSYYILNDVFRLVLHN